MMRFLINQSKRDAFNLLVRFNSSASIKYTKLFIDNEFVDSRKRTSSILINPTNEQVLASVQEADETDVNLAVASAQRAFEPGSRWRSMAPSDRGALIHRFAQLIRRDQCDLARLETLNSGKVYSNSLGDIDSAIKCLEYYAGWCDKLAGQTLPVDATHFSYTLYEPIGVCAQIIPWNYPILLAAWKMAPALAAGNTLVLKPAEQTPLTALHMAALAKEAGFPAGVINVINGRGNVAGQALAMHRDVNKISFTGSTAIGKRIQEASGQSNLKRVLLELGGKSPFIIFDLDDKNLRRAAEEAANSIFNNQGQSCSASSRIFVHESVHDKFVQMVKELAERRVIGDPFDEKTTNGPVVTEVHMKRILAYIESGKAEGAKCIAGGNRLNREGYFLRPTIFTNVDDNMKIAREEIFGPVLCVLKFRDIKEVIKRANNTSYGLAAGVFCSDINKILPIVNSLQAGSVFVNCYDAVFNQGSFGGYKESGIGRVLGESGLKEYLEIKNVTIKIND